MASLFCTAYMLVAIWIISGSVHSSDFKRTIVLVRVETKLGENVFLRGGRNGSCSMDVRKDPCSIPIVHRLGNTTPPSSAVHHWARGDNYLDWHGSEAEQGKYHNQEATGTPMLWTTSEFIPGGPVVIEDGYGYTTINQYGSHFWLLDVDMDCSKTDRGWFEFKAYVSPSRGWESDILQSSACGGKSTNKAPYAGHNHMAVCGKFNMFYYANGGCIIDSINDALEQKTSANHCGVVSMVGLKVLNGGSDGQTSRAKRDPDLTKSETEVSFTEPKTKLMVSSGNERLNFNSKPFTSQSNRTKASSTRIMHGHPAPERRWPWMTEILYKGHHGCGAVLISPHWVVTAGHCVRTATRYGVWGLIVRFGELDRTRLSGHERDYFVKQIIKHPLFDKTDAGSDVDNDNDIALLELVYPVYDVHGVSPICLPRQRTTDQFVGRECWAIGWGKTDGNNNPSHLQEVKMAVHSSTVCSHDYGSRVSSRQLCAGGGLISACSGDSGSPISCLVDGRWFLAGVVSWGDDNCTGRPSIYTRISAHLDWIEQHTGLGGHTPSLIG